MDSVTIRCSSLPLAFTCPGSIRGDLAIDSVNAPADDGTAVHAGLASVVRGMAPECAYELMLAEFPACNRSEITPLFWSGVKMWGEISKWMPNPRAEVERASGCLTGHLDVESEQGTEGAVVDWKSGRKDRDYRAQGFGYTWLLLAQNPDLERATLHFAWLRTGEIESYTVDRARADAWYQELHGQVINWDGKYREGDHCTFCPRRHSCPACLAMVRADVAMFADGRAFELSTCTPPELCEFFRKIKMLQHQLDAAERNARIEIAHRGDVLDGKGGVIHYVPTRGNREIHPLKAWDILTKQLSDEEMATVVEIGVGKMEAAIVKKANKDGRGKGAAAVRALSKELEAAGAVSREAGQKLCDERVK